MWLGGTLTANNDTAWVTGETWLYSNWFPGQPMIAPEKRLAGLFRESETHVQWGLMLWSMMEDYICEKDLV